MAEKKKPTLVEQFWPDISTLKGKQSAAKQGAFAAGWNAGSYALNSVFLFWTGSTLFGEKPADEIELYSFIGIFGFLTIVGTFLCWRIWKHYGHISATITLIWTLVEVISKFAIAPGKGIVVSILLTFCAINGVRGVFGYRAWLKERETDLSERGETDVAFGDE